MKRTQRGQPATLMGRLKLRKVRRREAQQDKRRNRTRAIGQWGWVGRTVYITKGVFDDMIAQFRHLQKQNEPLYRQLVEGSWEDTR